MHLFIHLYCLGLGGPATHRPHTYTHTQTCVHIHTHVELPTMLLIVKMVFQSNGEIKGEKRGVLGLVAVGV